MRSGSQCGGIKLLGVSAITGEQLALIADPKRIIGKFVHHHRAAHKMEAVRGLRQLQDELFEAGGVVCSYDALVLD